MTIDDVIHKIEAHETAIGNFFADGGGIHRLYEIELSKTALIRAIEEYKGRAPLAETAPKTDANAEL